MSNNTTLNAGSGGDTIRNLDRGSAKTSISLLDVGGTSTESIVGDSGVQLPIKGSGTAGTAATGVVTVQGIASMTPIATSPIPSQVGITGGVGVVAANTPRVNLATDDLAVTSLALLDDVVFAEDVAHSTGNKGVQVLTVRKDTATALADTDGDYQPPITDATGRVHTTADFSAASGAAPPSKLCVIAGHDGSSVVRITAYATTSDGEGTSNPRMYTDSTMRVYNGSTLDRVRGDSTNGIDVDITRIAAGDNNIGNVDIVTMPAVTNAGTFAVQESGAALTALQLIDDTVYTDGTGTPSKAIGIAGTDGTNPQIVSTNSSGHVNIADGGNVISVDDGASSLTIDNSTLSVVGGGTEATAMRVTIASDSTGVLSVDDNGSTISVDDGAGSLTIDNAALSVTGGGVEASALRVTIANDSTGVLSVDDNGGSLTVDGTVAATQSGTWNIGTVTTVTTVSTVTAVSDAQVQGKAAHDAAVSGNPVLLGGYAKATAPTDVSTDGDAVRVWCDLAGRVQIGDGGSTISIDDGAGAITVDGTVTANLAAGTNNIGDVDILSIAAGDNNIGNVDIASIAAGDNNIGNVDIVTVPSDPFGANADAASATGSISAKLRFIASTGIPITGTVTVGSHAVTNAGTFAVQVDGSALTALQLIDDTVFTDDAAFTAGTSKVLGVGFFADESSTDSVDEGDIGAARMTLDRKVIVTPLPHAAGGLSIFRSLDLDETEEDVKTSAGTVYGCWVTNTATTTRWLKFYNATAANTTVGSTTPVITIGIPGNTSDDVSGNFGPGGMGIKFDTAICVAATTGLADADTGAPSANDLVVNIFYV